jgi:integrase/recombinase XerD
MLSLQTFSILFWIKKNQIKHGKAPIFARVTVDSRRAEISTHRSVSIVEWNPEAQMVISKN